MATIEVKNAKGFIAEMQEAIQKTKYKLYFTQKGRVVGEPIVSTPRRNKIFLANYSKEDKAKIEEAFKDNPNVNVRPVIRAYHFDEKRDPAFAK